MRGRLRYLERFEGVHCCGGVAAGAGCCYRGFVGIGDETVEVRGLGRGQWMLGGERKSEKRRESRARAADGSHDDR